MPNNTELLYKVKIIYVNLIIKGNICLLMANYAIKSLENYVLQLILSWISPRFPSRFKSSIGTPR